METVFTIGEERKMRIDLQDALENLASVLDVQTDAIIVALTNGCNYEKSKPRFRSPRPAFVTTADWLWMQIETLEDKLIE